MSSSSVWVTTQAKSDRPQLCKYRVQSSILHEERENNVARRFSQTTLTSYATVEARKATTLGEILFLVVVGTNTQRALGHPRVARILEGHLPHVDRTEGCS